MRNDKNGKGPDAANVGSLEKEPKQAHYSPESLATQEPYFILDGDRWETIRELILHYTGRTVPDGEVFSLDTVFSGGGALVFRTDLLPPPWAILVWGADLKYVAPFEQVVTDAETILDGLHQCYRETEYLHLAAAGQLLTSPRAKRSRANNMTEEILALYELARARLAYVVDPRSWSLTIPSNAAIALCVVGGAYEIA